MCILKCNRGGPFPACLDWCEICDGKVDCIEEDIDEKDCDQLEINELVIILLYFQEERISSGIISTDVNPSHRCLSINELFNETIVELRLIRRIKYYHIPCQQHSDLVCFFDDTQICICNLNQHANCFEFNHNIKHYCRGKNYCENSGRCFQDDSTCLKASSCSYQECYYGCRCQLSSKGFSLSLDLILS
ncbi:unnamed protein product [Rotaria sp. Silwood2]|nr:unnamed protein product [Rotaria sp. Silwood2]